MKLVWTILATIFLSANVLNAQLDLVAPSTPLGVQAFGYEKMLISNGITIARLILQVIKFINGTEHSLLFTQLYQKRKVTFLSMLVRWELVILLKLVHMI